MKLYDLFDMDLYRDMLFNKYVRTNKHPNLPLTILNYTEKAQFENVWNDVTKKCRGLIIDDKLNIVARPFDKFMNYGQNQADIFLKDYAVQVTDKMDGSLGIIFEYRGDWYVATRGSFTSDQAIWATSFLRTPHKGYRLDLWHTNTYLAEIIYPGNRIVLDYGDREELVLLAARDAVTGSVRLAEAVEEWYGPKTTTFSYKTLTEALEAPPRINAEGYVVYFSELDYRVKIKQDDYVALHKIVTGLTERRIWENMKEGKSLDDLCSIVPDEWHMWLRNVYGDIMAAYNMQTSIIRDEYEDLVFGLFGIYGMDWTRKQFAEEAFKYEYTGFMFMILDHKPIEDKVWDLVKPVAES
jgi:RNA ligase